MNWFIVILFIIVTFKLLVFNKNLTSVYIWNIIYSISWTLFTIILICSCSIGQTSLSIVFVFIMNVIFSIGNVFESSKKLDKSGENNI